MKRLLQVITISVISSIAAVSWAQETVPAPPSGPPPMGPKFFMFHEGGLGGPMVAGGGFGISIQGPGLMMFLNGANLTADQKTKVRQIMQTNASQIMPLMDQVHKLREQIAAKLLGSGSVSAADLAPMEQQISQLQQQIDQDNLNASLQVRNVLTPDQLSHVAQLQQKLQSLHEQIAELMKEAGGPPMAPPGGLD